MTSTQHKTTVLLQNVFKKKYILFLESLPGRETWQAHPDLWNILLVLTGIFVEWIGNACTAVKTFKKEK